MNAGRNIDPAMVMQPTLPIPPLTSDPIKNKKFQDAFNSKVNESIQRVLNDVDLETLYDIKQLNDEPMQIVEDQQSQEFGKSNNDGTSFSKVQEDILADQQFSIDLEKFIHSRLVIGVSPTGTSHLNEDTAKSNKDKFSADQSHEIPSIFTHVTENMEGWANLKSHDDI